MQCDCEAPECGHIPGACKRAPSVKIEVFRMKENLCAGCLEIAQTSLEGDTEAGLRIVGPVSPV